MKWLRLCIGIIFVLAIAGCGLPDEVKNRAKELPAELEKAVGVIASGEESYSKIQQGEEYKNFLAKYDQRENWKRNFSKAKAKLADARQITDGSLKEIIDRNKEEEADLALKEISRIMVLKKESVEFAQATSRRIDFLKKVKAEAPTWIAKARQEFANANAIHMRMLGIVQGAEERHSYRKDGIAARFSPYKNSFDSAQMQMQNVETEFKNYAPDYAIFGDSCVGITKNLKLLTDGEGKFREVINQLDRSYSKTLVDMRADYYVQVGRVSWDECYSIEYPTEHSYIYQPAKVDEAAFDYFDDLPDEADLANLRGSLDVKVDNSQWASLKLDSKENWPGSDNEADYYLENLTVKLFHKYTIIENGIKKETDWAEVDGVLFEANDENLGMDIIAKPYGVFEDEAIKTATPMGMAYVGNQAYGRWTNDSRGVSFWEFYGRYRLIGDMLGDQRYYRSEYDTWYRDYRGKKPYYGPSDEKESRYGSGSLHAQTRYAGSHYAKTGGFKSEDTSVRSAGSSARGGGPSGGGK